MRVHCLEQIGDSCVEVDDLWDYFSFSLKKADRTHIPLIAPLFRNNTHFLYYTGTIVANRTIAPLTEHCNAPKRTTTTPPPPRFQTLFRNSNHVYGCVSLISPISADSSAGVDLEAEGVCGGGGGRGRLLPLQRLRRPRAANHVEEDGG